MRPSFTILESDKTLENITNKRAKEPHISQQVTKRPQGADNDSMTTNTKYPYKKDPQKKCHNLSVNKQY